MTKYFLSVHLVTIEKLSVEDYRDKIHSGEMKDPLVFLEAIMVGQDPRQLSAIYQLVLEIEEFSDGQPSKSEWSEVFDLVSTAYKYRTVSSSESIAAAKTLAEYLHAKRKQIDINNNESESQGVTPLTEEEIILFKEKFNDEF